MLKPINVEIKGLVELKALLHETVEIVEQLQTNLDEISKCNLTALVQKTKYEDS